MNETAKNAKDAKQRTEDSAFLGVLGDLAVQIVRISKKVWCNFYPIHLHTIRFFVSLRAFRG